MTAPVSLSEILIPLLPDIGLLILLLVVIFIDLYTRPLRRRVTGYVAGFGIIIILIVNLVVGLNEVNNPAFAGAVLGGMLRYDMLALIFGTMVLLAGALTCFIALDVESIARQGEFYMIVIVATLGMVLMGAASDLIMAFLALETTSISLYVLAGFLRDTRRSTEAGIKYFLFGAFTSGVMLYGLSLLYGFATTTDIYAIAGQLSDMLAGGGANASFGVVIALLFVLFGFGFKVAAVPFHFWTPDVYEGAPTPVTAFVSTASKAASFALFLRVFAAIWPVEAVGYWTSLVAAIAVVTMSLGNLLALGQSNIKRMLAYSSIAQAGYTLIGVVAIAETELGAAAVAFYMLMYVLTNIMAFTVVIIVTNHTGGDDIKDFAMLSRRAPYLAIAMVLALLSLSGVPPVAGFFGKFFLFAAAVQAGYVWLAIIGVLNAIVALYYYLTVIKVMYVDPNEDLSRIRVSPVYTGVLMFTGLGILVMGTLAGPWWNWAINAAQSLALSLP